MNHRDHCAVSKFDLRESLSIRVNNILRVNNSLMKMPLRPMTSPKQIITCIYRMACQWSKTMEIIYCSKPFVPFNVVHKIEYKSTIYPFPDVKNRNLHTTLFAKLGTKIAIPLICFPSVSTTIDTMIPQVNKFQRLLLTRTRREETNKIGINKIQQLALTRMSDLGNQ